MCHQDKIIIRQIMAFAVAIIWLVCCAPMAKAAESGTCGDGLSWYLSAGTLTITGSGKMDDFPEDTMAPWYEFREDVTRVELPDGMTHIGDLAFYDCMNLTAVAIPGSVESIGIYAFANCTELELLNLGGRAKTIGEGAFSDCYSLKSLDLPGTLTHIGTKAFYRCESITTVTVPSSVTSMGVSVFAYCKSLVSANVQANINTLPEFMFYGCERLTSVTLPDTTDRISSYSFRGCNQLNIVYHGGSGQTLDQIMEDIGTDVPEFVQSGVVTNEKQPESITSSTEKENENGSRTQENVTVTPGTNASITTKVEKPVVFEQKSDGKTEITITVNGDKGWEEATDTLQKELEKTEESSGSVNVDVYVKDTNEIDSGFVECLAGKDVNVTITTQTGSVWKMDATQLDSSSLSGKYNLSYTLSAGSQELSNELGTHASFVLTFAESAQVNSEILIRLGNSWAFQEATLFQRNKDGLTRIQSTVVDRDGYAHFYLAAVDKNTEYCIGMNMPAQAEEEAPIVPEELMQDYGNAVNYTPIEYEITGRSSSWGMNLGQVMGILAAVMVSVIVIVGVTMYILNKRRLKNGYVPQWDDEDDD